MTKLFQIKNTHIFYGPNTYAYSPVILVDIEINSLSYSKAVTACQ